MVEVVRSMETVPSGSVGRKGGGAQEVDGEFRLRKKEVPHLSIEHRVDSAESGDEVVLPSKNAAFGSAGTVVVWWNILNGDRW